MTDLLDKFTEFLEDSNASTMYITGQAGTGKTTKLGDILKYCIDNKISTVTCAYTHKAVGILASKVPWGDENVICTLHSFLCKRPSINGEATKVAHLEGNTQVGIPKDVKVVFVDEFSMVGEKDHDSLNTLQYNEEGDLLTKVVYIGDVNQLPPVKDEFTIVPQEPYYVKLTKVYRQAGDNPLIDTLTELNDFINGEKVSSLQPHSHFIRGQDIVDLYSRCKTSKVLLAYTNAKVEALNAMVQGRDTPLTGDTLFSPTTRQVYSLEAVLSEVFDIIKINGDILEINSKYKTLETLHTIEGVQFFALLNEKGIPENRAVVFGHDSFLKLKTELGKHAAKTNRDIEKQTGEQPSWWAKANWQHHLARARSEAWKKYLAFKDTVICIDFNHAMTIHKSQGSTYENVFLDMDDIGICADRDYKLYLKLLYVAISRASNKVYTN